MLPASAGRQKFEILEIHALMNLKRDVKLPSLQKEFRKKDWVYDSGLQTGVKSVFAYVLLEHDGLHMVEI